MKDLEIISKLLENFLGEELKNSDFHFNTELIKIKGGQNKKYFSLFDRINGQW